MSGGALNYAHAQMETAAKEVFRQAETSLHRAFATHLLKVAKALHDLEWVLSSDYGPGGEIDAIKAVVSPEEELRAVTDRAQETLEELRNLLLLQGLLQETNE